ERGLLMKPLLQTGARVSEFVNIKVEDFFFDETMILIAKAKGGKSRYVPILSELAQELRTHLGDRSAGYLFETNRRMRYSSRRIQQIVKGVAERAKIKKRVYPHLLRHSVATTLLKLVYTFRAMEWKPGKLTLEQMEERGFEAGRLFKESLL